MPAISVERTIGETKRAVLGGLIGYNTEKMGKQKYKRLAISLRQGDKIVGAMAENAGKTLACELDDAVRTYNGDEITNGVQQCGELLRTDECGLQRGNSM